MYFLSSLYGMKSSRQRKTSKQLHNFIAYRNWFFFSKKNCLNPRGNQTHLFLPKAAARHKRRSTAKTGGPERREIAGYRIAICKNARSLKLLLCPRRINTQGLHINKHKVRIGASGN